jgi:signal transduction histidine kinase
MTELRIRNSIIAGISIVVIVVITIMTMLANYKVANWVVESNEAKLAMLQVYKTIQEAESAQRGYLLTGNKKYLNPLATQRISADSQLIALKTWAADNPRQRENLIRLSAYSNARFNNLAKTIDLYQSGQVEAALNFVNTDIGESLMRKIEELKDAMVFEEDKRLYERQRRNLFLERISLALLALATTAAGYNLFRLSQRIAPLITSLDLANENLKKSIEEKNQEIELRRQAEKKTAHLVQILTNKNRELNHFAYIASHDLQEPLRTVSNFIEVFKEDYQEKLGEDAHQYFDFIIGATQRMKALIEGLLNYSRLGKSRGPEMVDLGEVITDIKGNLKAAIESKNATVSVEGPMPAINCLRTETTQLFQNLINNAIKYTAPDTEPRITVKATDKGHEWEFCVTDNGIGISPNHQEKIFNMFSRLHNEDEFQGQGIGLAFCKKIAELHNGAIWVESEPGKGSAFYFTISKSQVDVEDMEQGMMD